jgi:hypothetical protein
MKRILLLSIAACILSSCHHTPTEPKPSTKQLIGAWNWILSEGGIYPRHETPENMGYHQTLVLRADSTATLTRTPDLHGVSYTGWYATLRRYYPITKDTEYFFGMYPFSADAMQPAELLQFHGPDTMLIGDMVADGIQSTYVRVR